MITRCPRPVTVVEVSGEVDLLTAPQLADRLGRCLVAGPPSVLVVDLRRAGFFGAAGLRVLLEAHRRAQALHSSLRVVANTPTVCRTLTITGLDQTLLVYPSLEPALNG